MEFRSSLSITNGFESYVRAFREVLSDPLLNRWYRRTLLKTAALSILLLVAILSVGIWYVNTSITEFYTRLLAVGAVAFLGLYFSTTLSALLMNSLVMLIGGEKVILNHFFLGLKAQRGLKIRERGGEILSVAKSLSFGILALPFLFIPYLIPIAVFLIAFGIGGEAIATGHRISHEYGLRTSQDEGLISWKVKIGLGLIPAIMGMIPIVGFFFLPVVVVAGLAVQALNRPTPGNA